MPVSAEYLSGGHYPANWKAISRYRREVIACSQCEWVEEDGTRCPRKHLDPIPGNPRGSHTILTTAHLDHDPTNCAIENLRSWCQQHHLRYDAPMHAKHAQATRSRRKNRWYHRPLFDDPSDDRTQEGA